MTRGLGLPGGGAATAPWELAGEALRRLFASGAAPEQSAPDGGPPPRDPPRGVGLARALDDAERSSAASVEALARGALAAGRRPSVLLDWAGSPPGEGRGGDGRAGAITAILRDIGYDPVLAWAERPHDDVVDVLPAPPGTARGLFTVPLRVARLGSALRRRFTADYPALADPLRALAPASDRELFRPEVVPALAREGGLIAALGTADDDRFESVVLPLSRVPGANVLVLAGLLVHELLDPMEILGWIGQDVHDLPRNGVPHRPEDVVTLPPPAPGGSRYMIFSDVHREPPVDGEFRIDHFARNRGLYLRALHWCAERGYTVVENGDCEELWFEPTFDPARRLSKRDRMTRIVDAHRDVYDLLAELDAQGRYLRTIGNHDSYLWEDPELRDWRAATGWFPAVHGGAVVDGVKVMDDLLPHVGLDPDAYRDRQSMLVLHGHHFDFWNCDEHNRLGKFIANAVGVLVDALDDVVYDWRGVDRLGHPLVELWDVLTPVAPFDNWPPQQIARTWAEAIEQRDPYANVTQDSVQFSETFAAAMAILMRSGQPSLSAFHVLLCLGHTHNPQSRPWITYLDRFNPWRDREIAGFRAFERLFSIKTRYLNSGTAGWWEGVVWAIEITNDGQPRLVYWASEDADPVPMDWELQEGPPLPEGVLDELAEWAGRYLRGDVAAALDALAAGADGAGPDVVSPALERLRRSIAAGALPDLASLIDLLAPTATATSGASPGLDGLFAEGLRLSDNAWHQAAAILAGRGDPALRGADPRGFAQRLAAGGTPARPPGLSPLLLPGMLTAADPDAGPDRLDVGKLVAGLRRTTRSENGGAG